MGRGSRLLCAAAVALMCQGAVCEDAGETPPQTRGVGIGWNNEAALGICPAGGSARDVYLDVYSYCNIAALREYAAATWCSDQGLYPEFYHTVAQAFYMVESGARSKQATLTDPSPYREEDNHVPPECDGIEPPQRYIHSRVLLPPPRSSDPQERPYPPTKWLASSSLYVRCNCCPDGGAAGVNMLQAESALPYHCIDGQNVRYGYVFPPTCDREERSGGSNGSPSIYLPGPGPAMALAFHYKSRTSRVLPDATFDPNAKPWMVDTSCRELIGPFGRGWTHSMDIVLKKTEAESLVQATYWWIVIENGDGDQDARFGYWSDGDVYVPAGQWKAPVRDDVHDSYTVEVKKGGRYLFSAHNDPFDEAERRYEVDRIEDANGNALQFTYDEDAAYARDRLVKVKDEGSGRCFRFIYMNDGGGGKDWLVDAIRFPHETDVSGNREWKLDYDAIGRLTSIEMKEGMHWDYEYADYVWEAMLPNPLDLTEPSDIEIDATLRAYRLDNITRMLDALGGGREYVYGGCEDAFVRRFSNSGRDYIWRIEEQEASVNQRDTTTWNYPAGGSGVPISNSASRVQQGGRFFTIGLPESAKVERLGTRAGFEETSHWERWLDDNGTVMEWPGGEARGFSRATQMDHGWDYEAFVDSGSLTASDTLPLDWVTCRKDALGRCTHFVYWSDDISQARWGMVKKVRGTDGVVTGYTYNGLGLPTEVVVDKGAGCLNLATTYAYDGQGNMTSVSLPIDQAGGVFALSGYGYSGNGDLEWVADPLAGSVGGGLRVTEFGYEPGIRDLASVTRRVRLDWDVGSPTVTTLTSLFEHDDFGNRTAIVDPAGRRTEFQFDEMDRLTKTKLPPANLGDPSLEVSYGYDLSGNLTSVTNPAGETVSYDYGLDNELNWVEVPLDGSRKAKTLYEYDDYSRLTAVEDALGKRTLYQYDNLGRLTNVTDALQENTGYVYDIGDRLTDRIDARGRQTRYLYQSNSDRLERTEYYGTDASLDESLIMGYDRLGRRTSVRVERPGQSQQVVEEVIYDDASRPKRIDGCCARHDYQFDLVGNRTGYQYFPDKAVPTVAWNEGYLYDELDRPIQVTRTEADLSEAQVGYHYNEAGNLVRMDYPNGCSVGYAFDGLDRLTSLTYYHDGGFGQEASEIASFGYEYDAASRRTRITRKEGIDITYTTYEYNLAGWLTRETRHEEDGDRLWDDVYAYDLVGNRTGKTHTDIDNVVTEISYEYNDGNQLIREYGVNVVIPTELKLTMAGQATDDEVGVARVRVTSGGLTVQGSIFAGWVNLGQAEQSSFSVEATDEFGNTSTTVFSLEVTGQTPDGRRVMTVTATDEEETRSWEIYLDVEADVRYSYDANGNLVGRSEGGETTGYEWDDENRLTRVVQPDGTEIAFEYCRACSLGLIAKKTKTTPAGVTTTTDWVWDGMNVIEQADSGDAGPTEYFGGVAVKKNGTWSYLLTDAMGVAPTKSGIEV